MASIIKSDNGVSSGITGIVQSADSSGQLALQTTTSSGTATTAVTIDNTQKVTFANSIGFGSNAGITFNNSSALTNSTLNDYETGTWTPALVSSGATFAYTPQSGSYIKIGQLVYAQFYIYATASGTTSNAVTFAGLPFTTTTVNNPYEQGFGGAWMSGTQALAFTCNPGSTNVTIWRQNGGVSTAIASDISAKYLVGTFIYRASA